MFADFINEYGTQILYLVITAVAGWVGTVFKKLYTKYVNTKVKKEVAKNVVLFVEQVYKDLHGEEKLTVAMTAFSEMLAEENIYINELEMRVLLEAAVAEFNDAFHKMTALPEENTALPEESSEASVG